MVKAEITIGTCYGDVVIPVEVLNRGPRPGMVWVRALNGLTPFTKTSHGGPCQDSTDYVLIRQLREVHIEIVPDANQEGEMPQENGIEILLPISKQQIPAINQGIPFEDYFPESAFTVSAQHPGEREV